MKIEQPQPWDRQPGETDTQYQQFLCFLNLGPGRTRAQAWSVYITDFLGSEQAPGSVPSGQFTKACNENDWVVRAVAFDMHQLGPVYHEIARDYVRGLRAAVAKAAEALEERDIDDPAIPGILEVMSWAGKHLEPALQAGLLGTTVNPALAHAAGSSQAALPVRTSESVHEPDAGWK